jgi:hypothetical protein
VTGDAGADTVIVRRQAAQPWMVEIVLNGVTQPLFQMTSVQKLEIDLGAGINSVVLDSTNGAIEFSDGITIRGNGTDTLVLQGPVPTGLEPAGPIVAGTGLLALTMPDVFGDMGRQEIAYVDVEAIQNNLGNPLAQRLDVLGRGLERLAGVTGALANRGLLSTRIPVLNDSLGRALNGTSIELPKSAEDPDAGVGEATSEVETAGSTLLRRLIEEGLGRFSLSDIGENRAINSVQALRAKLDALDGVAGNVTVTELANKTLFTMALTKSLSGMADLDVLSQVLGGTVNFDGQMRISADVSVQLTFGVDAGGFFVQPNSAGTPEFTVRNIRVNGETMAPLSQRPRTSKSR